MSNCWYPCGLNFVTRTFHLRYSVSAACNLLLRLDSRVFLLIYLTLTFCINLILYICTTKKLLLQLCIYPHKLKAKLRGFKSASELYRPSDRRLSAKLVPTVADRRCHVVSATNPPCRYFRIYPHRLLLFWWYIFSSPMKDMESFNA
jgi:hypothetical protein